MKFSKTVATIGLVLAALTQQSVGKVHQLWKLGRGFGDKSSLDNLDADVTLDNERLQSMNKKFVFEVDVASFADIQETDSVSFEFPDTLSGKAVVKTCSIKKGNLAVPDALHEKFPSIVLLRGNCGGVSEVTFIADSKKPGSLSGRYTEPNSRSYYIDVVNQGQDRYMIYDTDIALREGKPSSREEDKVIVREEVLEVNRLGHRLRAEKKKNRPLAYKLRLALIANKEYSIFHGNTLESVFAAMVTAMDRNNGVYMHEFGTYFELIERNNELICLDGTNDELCNGLPNSPNLINSNGQFITQKGIPFDSYDIGHSFSTGGGGVAGLGVICQQFKADGTTGQPSPVNDPFAIDYVAHEIGHQAVGRHTFRDCDGFSDSVAGIEPGSAITIMGYAGLCGDRDLASNSEPVFDNLNLKRMKDFFDSIQDGGNCGTAFDLEIPLPEVSAPETCAVPVGNYFQLRGKSNSSPNDSVEQAVDFYSWSRIDVAFEDFFSPTLGKFRPWKPTKSTSRYFPNLHFLNNPDPEFDRVEKLPTVERTMLFRFVDRRLYDTDITVSDFDVGVAGQFAFVDTLVQYNDVAPLELTAPASGDGVETGSYTLKWNAGGSAELAEKVEFFIALDTTDEVAPSEFDYEINNKEFDWVKIGEAEINSGELNVLLPNLGLEIGETAEVNIMARASQYSGEQSEQCFFFDLAVDLTLSATTIISTNEPTTSPEPSPTSPPVTEPPNPSPGGSPTPTTDEDLVLVIAIFILAAVVILLSAVIILFAFKYSRANREKAFEAKVYDA